MVSLKKTTYYARLEIWHDSKILAPNHRTIRGEILIRDVTHMVFEHTNPDSNKVIKSTTFLIIIYISNNIVLAMKHGCYDSDKYIEFALF